MAIDFIGISLGNGCRAFATCWTCGWAPTLCYRHRHTPQTSQWRPLRSLGVRTDLLDDSEQKEGPNWFGAEALYSAEVLQKYFLVEIFDLVNETDKKERLEAIFLEGKNLESGSDDAHETSINLLQLIEQLDLKDRFSSRFKVALAAVAKDWKDREALVKIYEGRIDII